MTFWIVWGLVGAASWGQCARAWNRLFGNVENVPLAMLLVHVGLGPIGWLVALATTIALDHMRK